MLWNTPQDPQAQDHHWLTSGDLLNDDDDADDDDLDADWMEDSPYDDDDDDLDTSWDEELDYLITPGLSELDDDER